MHWESLFVFIFLFLIVGVIGIYAWRWRKGDSDNLSEWGLGGRNFGIVVSWFLIGGDLYTAYTLIAVPALVFGKGAIGLFALPYTIVVYPLMLLVMPRLWQIAKERGHVTPSDYVKDRFNSRTLALLVAITGIIAIIPYAALQMYGIEVVLAYMGVPAKGALIVGFVILAIFTYISGLRAPALISLVKDTLIYSTFIVAVIYIPIKLGGYGSLFAHISPSKLILPASQYSAYSSLFLGSALALFLYPHAITAVMSSKSRKVVKTNMSILPIYTFLLGLIALLGYMAIAIGLKATGAYGANGIVPELFLRIFPPSFVGYAFAAIAIGALVPASIMGIAAGNLFSRNIYQEFFRPKASARKGTSVAKIVAVMVMVAALLFIITSPAKFVINFQLAGGTWMLQALPAIFLALFIPWLDKRAVVAGWAVGIGWGTYQLIQEGFSSSLHSLSVLGGLTVYIGLSALVANVIVVFIGTAFIRLLGVKQSYKSLTNTTD
ncbi:MAG: sodium:solute symporter [Chitinophagaceae bacterium]|nr:MAG: sodium:solute symporter [Chitinophagaceae bacterium]